MQGKRAFILHRTQRGNRSVRTAPQDFRLRVNE